MEKKKATRKCLYIQQAIRRVNIKWKINLNGWVAILSHPVGKLTGNGMTVDSEEMSSYSVINIVKKKPHNL
jgi:hypothetical protein